MVIYRVRVPLQARKLLISLGLDVGRFCMLGFRYKPFEISCHESGLD